MRPAGPPPVDPDEARRRIHEELSKAEYDDSPGFIDWLLGTIESWLLEIVDGIDGSSAAQAGIAVAMGVVLVVAAVLVLRRTGLIRRGHTLAVAAELDAQPVLSGAELRASAGEAVSAGRTDDGIVLALRALVRDLEERTLLDVTAGMTAHEAADRAARPYPELRGRLERGADAFDTAAYSHRTATAKQADDLLRLAEYIADSAPDLTGLGTTADAGAEDPLHPRDAAPTGVGG
ncbi:DUF4129 domain-containing protein [Brachybacterium sp. YJGR34]|uniref:DUF4129 domain-containing protein n=1 Tax=Brachybacterium sp. YJGR34 TaxID=2059911 RepID=UPI000E0A23A5|nr:DUF4129 domain-containing protein [Brachybacterium sp. YJGR34]